ncbi:MAG: helix-turn-helix transcriptional regulator [Ruminococcus sp.]|nr:helix-turn-helix transcriptional regulator [Ruminococcus sp.]
MPKKKRRNIGTVFSNNLGMLRKKNGFTQQQVADYLSINRSTYTKYETGVSEPSIITIRKLAELFSVDANTLIEDIQDPHLAEESSYHFNLTKNERDIIAYYRKLDENEKKRIRVIIARMLQANENNE